MDIMGLRKKYGRIDEQKKFSSAFKNRGKFLDTKYNSGLSFLHDPLCNAAWAKEFKIKISNMDGL